MIIFRWIDDRQRSVGPYHEHHACKIFFMHVHENILLYFSGQKEHQTEKSTWCFISVMSEQKF